MLRTVASILSKNFASHQLPDADTVNDKAANLADHLFTGASFDDFIKNCSCFSNPLL